MNAKTKYFWVIGGVFAAVMGAVGFLFIIGPAKTMAPRAVDPRQTTAGTNAIVKAVVRAADEKTVKLPILMYHHVGALPDNANAIQKDLTVPTANFEQQVAWVKSQGYQSVSLEDVYLYSQGKFTLPPKPMVFTFDDGYGDVFQNAVPILQKYGYSGSFGIITNFPGTMSGNNTYATWSTIQTAASSGMEIVCHTQNHFDGSNPKFTAAYIFSNLSGCKSSLASHGINTNILVYPYGHYTPMYIQQANSAGFVMALTTSGSDILNLNDLMRLPRVRVHGAENMQRFQDILLDKFIPQTSPTSTRPD